MEAQVAQSIEKFRKSPENLFDRNMVYLAEYVFSKYVRKDNTPDYALYLGYLDARRLYPDMKLRTFREFVVDLLDGKVVRPYSRGG